MTSDHLVITVHGIRTFGQWQERLEALVMNSSDEDIEFTKIDYGYFSVIAFFLPFVRWMATRRIKRLLLETIIEHPWRRIDIVAHSFGTHLVSWSLKSLCRSHRGKIHVHTLILAGSVLRPWFRWELLLDGDDRCLDRVVNDCGTKDSILVLSQVAILLTGMAGRIGFRGRIREQLRNRYFRIGHSGYFVTGGQPNDFMSKWWLPLITQDQQVAPHDERSSDALAGLQTWLLQFAEPIKFSVYAAGIVFGVQLSMELLTEARHARLDRILEAQDSFWKNQDHERAAISALEAYSFNVEYKLGRLGDVEEAIRDVFSSRPFRFEISAESGAGTGAISSDGQIAATGFDDGRVEIWDLSKNNWSSRSVVSVPSTVTALAFQPGAHGFAGGNKDGSVWLYGQSATANQATVLGNCSGQIESISVERNGRLVAAGTEDGMLCLWDSNLGTKERQTQYNNSVRAVSFSRDGRHFAMAEGNRFYLWNTVNLGTEAFKALKGVPSEERITAIAFSADSSLLAAASYQSFEQAKDVNQIGWSFVRIWRLDAPDRPLGALLKVQTMVLSLTFGQELRLGAAGSDGVIRIWALSRPGDPVLLKGFSGPALFVGFGGETNRLISVGVGKPTVVLWDYAAAVAHPRSFRGSKRPALAVGFCKEEFGTLAVGYQMEGSVYLFDLSVPHSDPVRMPELDGEVVALSCDAGDPLRMATGRGAFLASGNGKVRLWDLRGSAAEKVLGEHLGSVLDVAIQSNGRIVVSAGEDDHTVKIIDTDTGESLDLHARELGGAPLTIAAVNSAGIATLAVGTEEGVVGVYTISTAPLGVKRIYQFEISERPEVLDVAFSADNQNLAAAYMDGIVRVWALEEGHDKPEYELIDVTKSDGSPVPWRVAYSPDGSTLAAGDTQGYVFLWQTAALREKASVLKDGPRRTIYALGFDPRGETLVAGFADGIVMLWPTLASLLRQGCDVLKLAPSGRQQLETIAAKAPCSD